MMSLLRNPRFTSLFNWVSQISAETLSKPQLPGHSRSFATRRTLDAEVSGEKRSGRPRNEIRKVAQVAMFDYFHHNRGLQFLVAESMSKNAPFFNDNLLKKLNGDFDADADADAGDDLVRSITRFLLFNPVNEFEPFLESLGLKPSEYSHLIPCDKMFLNEDAFLLENYHVFWNYGIDRKKMGKIFKEAREVFGYETGVLAAKIQAYEDLGFSKVFLSKVIVCSPSILIGDMNVEMAKVIGMLRTIGFGFDWVAENLSEEATYDWSSMHRCLRFLRDVFLDESELRELMKKQPRLVFESSGEWTLMLAGFETKLGSSSRSELSSLFQKLPEVPGLGKCVSNLRHCFLFLKEIEMEAAEIGKVLRVHSWWLCASRLKQTSTYLNILKCGKRRLCQVIQENPEEMKKWSIGLKVQPLPGSGVDFRESKAMKIQFLLDLGYKENSKEMERALKSFRGRGSELSKRFSFFVSLGLDEEVVKDMVRASPDVLTQASDVLETKVKYLVEELGYPLSALVAFPSCLKYTLEKMKLRFGMFAWLQARGKAGPKLAISSILVYSEKSFATRFVNRHPDGPKHFEELKKQLLCE
ncbi:unnamed protein product [Microthlaspi erraticum]|uniref:Transcription termination factor MTEF18, mitochondrial n=1 Tax=Microthlaspi erraticum TaxID=1685480 RepID=A0A6D2IML6_9BRAS|nr:unnamed protein product [Microthlaspi erraticum]